MKRNILLAFLLVGLVVMEWGCNDTPGPCPPSTSNVIGIDSTAFYKLDSNNYRVSLNSDSVNYQNMLIQVSFKTELVSLLQKSSSIYAVTLPADA